MVGALFLLFVIVPFVELFLILQVGQAIGAPWTIVLLLAMSVIGATLVKREGFGVVRRAQARIQRGEVPARELVDGVMILFAGALLLTPGFLTDVFGVLLLIPPVRIAMRASAIRILRKRVMLR